MGQRLGMYGVSSGIKETPTGTGETGSVGPSEKTSEFSSEADFMHCPESDFGHQPLIWSATPAPILLEAAVGNCFVNWGEGC